tara:strand:- start:5971 stop:6858 length:888 start_codon:yes stop_codon:yes gene_type:complete
MPDTNRKSDVALIVANFNNGRFLHEFFQSVLRSQLIPEQICFVDDGSTDESLKIAESYREKLLNCNCDLNIVSFGKNRGFGYALNEAIDLCRTTYSARIDPDDRLYPQRLSRQVGFMKLNPEVSVLGSNIAYFHSDTGASLRSSNVPVGKTEINRQLQKGCIPVIHGSSIFKTEVLKSFKYRPDTVPAEDYDLFSRVLSAGSVIENISEVLTEVRIHDKSVSNSLPITTIEKTFRLREENMSIPYRRSTVLRRYLHQKYYRRYLYTNGVIRYLYLFIAALCWPDSVRRNIGKVNA